MTAQASRIDPDDSYPPAIMPRSVYLDAYLAPLRPWLERETVTEIIVNRPGELWIEDAAKPGMQRVRLDSIDDQLLQRLAEQVARISHQGVNREHPLLAATLRAAPARQRRAAARPRPPADAATAASPAPDAPAPAQGASA